MIKKRLPPGLNELVTVQPLPHLLWRIGEWQALSQHELRAPLLDLGCGDGWFGRMLFQEPTACGVDWDLSNAQHAHRLGVYRHVVNGDATRLPFADGSYATILANSALEHMANLEAVLHEVYRLLWPDGFFYTTVPVAGWTSMGFHQRWLGHGYARWLNRYLDHRHIHDLDTWTHHLAQAGLKVKKVEMLLSPQAVACWDLLLPAQFLLRRVNRILPWYRWLRGQRYAALVQWVQLLELNPREKGGVLLLIRGQPEGERADPSVELVG